MKISLLFPAVVPIDENDDVFAQKEVLLNVFQFDPDEVAQQRSLVKKKLELIDFVRLSHYEAYFYSPLFTGRNLTTDDEEVCFAYFDHKHSQYKQSPEQYYSTKQRNAYKKNNSLPVYMPWEVLEPYLDEHINGPHLETHFARWLAVQQNKTLTAEVSNTSAKTSAARKI